MLDQLRCASSPPDKHSCQCGSSPHTFSVNGGASSPARCGCFCLEQGHRRHPYHDPDGDLRILEYTWDSDVWLRWSHYGVFVSLDSQHPLYVEDLMADCGYVQGDKYAFAQSVILHKDNNYRTARFITLNGSTARTPAIKLISSSG